MITIRLHRDPDGKPSGMTANQWDAQVRLRQTEGGKRAIGINVNRAVRETIKKYLAELEEKRQEAMENWTKQQ